MQKVDFKTKDGVNIAGSFYPVEKKTALAVVLLHMMPETKESWKDFAEKFNKARFQALAIDLRGHGESDGGPNSFLKFSNEEHQASIKDVEAAVNFFVEQGISLEKIVLIGASIGANLALQFQAEHPQIKASILLSPGLNYRGVETEPAAGKITENQSVFLAAGGENDDYSTETAQILSNMLKSKNKKLKIIDNAGHGTDILNSQRFLINEIILWIQSLNLKT